MTCFLCETGEIHAGKVTLTLERRDDIMVVVNGVPAQICQNCGESYIDQDTRSQLLRMAETDSAPGVRVDIREYSTALVLG